jgi:hypothetical protein
MHALATPPLPLSLSLFSCTPVLGGWLGLFFFIFFNTACLFFIFIFWLPQVCEVEARVLIHGELLRIYLWQQIRENARK